MSEVEFKEQAKELLKNCIEVSNWRQTDLGSGYKFRLKNPFAKEGDLWDSILQERLYLDMYDGMDEDEELLASEEEKADHFKQHQDGVYEWGLSKFLAEMTEKYLHKFEEYILQRQEMLTDY